MAKNLIAYYSRADENYVDGTLKMLKIGNTERAAGMISEFIEGDLFKIEQSRPYSKNYQACTEEAKEDQKKEFCPKLIRYPDSLDEYDVIYLGFPNYWGTMPMAVFTFLEHYDFSDKTIRPFCTHEGSGLGSSLKDIQRLCPNAVVKSGLAVYGSEVESSRKEIERWVK